MVDTATKWLLASSEPAIRYRARAWLLGQRETGPAVRADRKAILDGPIVATLLELPGPRVHPYRKWSGVHWRLVSLADFELPVDRPETRAAVDEALERELRWMADPKRLDAIPKVGGLYRADASMEGNAVYAASRFGRAGDERVRRLVERLLAWQWPDGGWNCDRAASGYRSSFHESWETAMGLAAYHDATGDADALAAARRTADLLLEHRLVRRLGSDKPIHSSFTGLHWPAYWHYDILAGLRVLYATGTLDDPRAAGGLALLASKQRPDGRFQPNGTWWRLRPGSSGPVDVIDWGKGRPSEVLTLHALRILSAFASVPGCGVYPDIPHGLRSPVGKRQPLYQ